MIRIGIIGEIGSGKSYVANSFGYQVFNADESFKTLQKRSKFFENWKKDYLNIFLRFQ